jgi:hypothetical protein
MRSLSSPLLSLPLSQDDGPDPPKAAAAAAAPAAAPKTDTPPAAPRKSKAKRKAAAAAEVVEEPPTTAPATPAAGGGGAAAADATPTPAPGDAAAAAQPPSNKKQKKKKKIAALPSGPGNADEAARIRSALGFGGGEAEAAAEPAAAAPAAAAPPAPGGTFAFGFSGGDDGATVPAVVADGGALDAAAAAAGARSTAPATALPPPPPRPPSSTPTTPAHPALARRVFVGGMPFGYEEDDVRQYWEWCGPVASLDLMRFPDTGRFRGIAFITFATDEAYAKALECDGTMLDGVRVKVEPCKKGAAGGGPGGGGPRRGHGGGGNGGNGGGAAAAPKVPGYNVAYVGNIAFEAGPDDVAALFAGCGSGVSRVRLHTDRLTGASRGYAHVHFRDEAGLDAAVRECDGAELCGRPVRVGYAQPKAVGEGGGSGGA